VIVSRADPAGRRSCSFSGGFVTDWENGSSWWSLQATFQGGSKSDKAIGLERCLPLFREATRQSFLSRDDDHQEDRKRWGLISPISARAYGLQRWGCGVDDSTQRSRDARADQLPLYG